MNHGWSTIERVDSGFVKVPSSRRMLCAVNSNAFSNFPATMPRLDPSCAYALLEEELRASVVRYLESDPSRLDRLRQPVVLRARTTKSLLLRVFCLDLSRRPVRVRSPPVLAGCCACRKMSTDIQIGPTGQKLLLRPSCKQSAPSPTRLLLNETHAALGHRPSCWPPPPARVLRGPRPVQHMREPGPLQERQSHARRHAGQVRLPLLPRRLRDPKPPPVPLSGVWLRRPGPPLQALCRPLS